MGDENGVEFENGIDWTSFRKYVEKTHAPSYRGNILRYSRMYAKILGHPDQITRLQVLPKGKQRLVMSSLANLSKFLGVYDSWQMIVKNGGLKYQKYNGLSTVISMLNTNIGDSKAWLLDVLQKVPKDVGTVLVFAALTGLRPSEAAMSCKMITELNEKGAVNEYYDSELGMLQHFKYKEKFLRNSKNAYFSFVTPQLMSLVIDNKPKLEYWAVQHAIQRAKLSIQAKKLRKLNATILRSALDSELVDLLQGRVGESVFVKSYYRPELGHIREKALKTLEPLQSELMSAMGS
jgi:hypothetical protein